MILKTEQVIRNSTEGRARRLLCNWRIPPQSATRVASTPKMRERTTTGVMEPPADSSERRRVKAVRYGEGLLVAE